MFTDVKIRPSSCTAWSWRWGHYNLSKRRYMLADSQLLTKRHEKTPLKTYDLNLRSWISSPNSNFIRLFDILKQESFPVHCGLMPPFVTPARRPNRVLNTFCTAPFRITPFQVSGQPLFHFLIPRQYKCRLHSKNRVQKCMIQRPKTISGGIIFPCIILCILLSLTQYYQIRV